jgi:hypothetical protein
MSKNYSRAQRAGSDAIKYTIVAACCLVTAFTLKGMGDDLEKGSDTGAKEAPSLRAITQNESTAFGRVVTFQDEALNTPLAKRNNTQKCFATLSWPDKIGGLNSNAVKDLASCDHGLYIALKELGENSDTEATAPERKLESMTSSWVNKAMGTTGQIVAPVVGGAGNLAVMGGLACLVMGALSGITWGKNR